MGVYWVYWFLFVVCQKEGLAFLNEILPTKIFNTTTNKTRSAAATLKNIYGSANRDSATSCHNSILRRTRMRHHCTGGCYLTKSLFVPRHIFGQGLQERFGMARVCDHASHNVVGLARVNGGEIEHKFVGSVRNNGKVCVFALAGFWRNIYFDFVAHETHSIFIGFHRVHFSGLRVPKRIWAATF